MGAFSLIVVINLLNRTRMLFDLAVVCDCNGSPHAALLHMHLNFHNNYHC